MQTDIYHKVLSTLLCFLCNKKKYYYRKTHIKYISLAHCEMNKKKGIKCVDIFLCMRDAYTNRRASYQNAIKKPSSNIFLIRSLSIYIHIIRKESLYTYTYTYNK